MPMASKPFIVFLALFLVVLLAGCSEQEEKQFWDDLIKDAVKDVLSGKGNLSIGGSGSMDECHRDLDCSPPWCEGNAYSRYKCENKQCVKLVDAPCLVEDGEQCVPNLGCVPVRGGKFTCLKDVDCPKPRCENNQYIKQVCRADFCEEARDSPCPDGFTCHPVNGCVPDLLETCKADKDCPLPSCGGVDGTGSIYYACKNGTCKQYEDALCSEAGMVCITGIKGCYLPGTQRCVRNEDCKGFNSPRCDGEAVVNEYCDKGFGVCRENRNASCTDAGRRCVAGQGCV